MTEEALAFGVELEHLAGYEFRVRFDVPTMGELTLDEPAPLGRGNGPNASRVLAAAVGNCLTASLLFCLRKARLEPAGLKTTVRGFLARNPAGRLRVARLEVVIALEEGSGLEAARLKRCTTLFEDFCVVTESVRAGIPVAVRVTDAAGATLFENPGLPPGARTSTENRSS
jgi:organic hydroperoxide reductase OsmC/OhrA